MLIRSITQPSRSRATSVAVALAAVGSVPVVALAANAARVTIREWTVPTASSLPHDPAIAPDGSLWYTEQHANKLGRLDPKTGAIREYPVTVPDSGPHGLVADAAGHIWFTANSKGYIGELDPKSGGIREYAMPDPRVKDPHTPAFGRDGKLYFTAQQSNFVGRVDPATGKVEVVSVPTANAQPYGLVRGPDDAIYFCEFGTNQLGRIDPATMTIREYPLPDRAARPRRIARVGNELYFTDFARGVLGRFDPRTGHVDEWPSPSGTTSKPYAITATSDGVVWFVETGVTPNRLVRFSPIDRSFENVPIPSGGGVVRNMVATGDNRLYLAESGVNKIAIAQIAASR